MINFRKYLYLENCVLLENLNTTKQMELHLTHIEDLAIEQGKNGFNKFVETVNLIVKKLKGQDSEIDINAKIDGSPALLFGNDPRDEYKNQFFIALKYVVDPVRGIIKEGAKLLHSEQEIQAYYGDRPSFAQKLKNLFTELNRAYDKSGTIYQCDVLYAAEEDKTVQPIDGEDYVVFKPNVIAYAIPVDPSSDTYNLVNGSTVGIVVHDSFKGTPHENYITLTQKTRRVDSIIDSGKRANVFIMGANFKQAKVDVEESYINQIDKMLNDCRNQLSLIEDIFDNEYVQSQAMEYLKIYINKQIDLPDGGIFGREFSDKDLQKFIKGFKSFIEKRFKIEIGKKKTPKGRESQQLKLDSLMNFIEQYSTSLFSLLKLFSIMIKVKKILLILVEKLSFSLKKVFFLNADGSLEATKGEGHVVFNGPTHVKIVDRMEFTKVNRSRGGQR